MIGALRVCAAILVIVRRDVDFAADDRLDAVRVGFFIKVCRREKIAVVGDGYCRHFSTCCFLGEFADGACAVEKGVVRVEMQMNEILG